MKRLRSCSICEFRVSEHLCKACGKAVCIAHYDLKTGTCSGCMLQQ